MDRIAAVKAEFDVYEPSVAYFSQGVKYRGKIYFPFAELQVPMFALLHIFQVDIFYPVPVISNAFGKTAAFG